MPPKPFHVTEAELSVLQVLWNLGSATTREICDAIYPEGTPSQYYTVQKLLERLESRDCVVRDRASRVHRFSPAIDRDTLLAERLRDLSDSLCDESVLPMLSGLLKLRRWNREEQKRLQQLVDDLISDSSRKKNG